MLAQSFKTYQDLKLDERVYEGLKKVLVRLETGNLVWVDHHVDSPPTNGFNINFDFEYIACGTIGCIGGWAAYEAGLPLKNVMNIQKLYELFYPDVGNWNDILTEQAATVLRHYLTTGEINWDTI